MTADFLARIRCRTLSYSDTLVSAMASRRRLARTAVVQTLFECDFHEGDADHERDPQELLIRNISELGKEEVDRAFAEELLEKTIRSDSAVREAMQTHAPQWPLERMDRITRCILMAGTCEILFMDDAPSAVVMNEAIEIAKEFGEEESGKFVNGVLNAIAHSS